MDQAEMTVRKSSIFMHRASLNQELIREAVPSLEMPTNSEAHEQPDEPEKTEGISKQDQKDNQNL